MCIHIYKGAGGCIRVCFFFHFRWSLCIKWKQLLSNASVSEEEGRLPPISPKGVAGSTVAFDSFYCSFPAYSYPQEVLEFACDFLPSIPQDSFPEEHTESGAEW